MKFGRKVAVTGLPVAVSLLAHVLVAPHQVGPALRHDGIEAQACPPPVRDITPVDHSSGSSAPNPCASVPIRGGR